MLSQVDDVSNEYVYGFVRSACAVIERIRKNRMISGSLFRTFLLHGTELNPKMALVHVVTRYLFDKNFLLKKMKSSTYRFKAMSKWKV